MPQPTQTSAAKMGPEEDRSSQDPVAQSAAEESLSCGLSIEEEVRNDIHNVLCDDSDHSEADEEDDLSIMSEINHLDGYARSLGRAMCEVDLQLARSDGPNILESLSTTAKQEPLLKALSKASSILKESVIGDGEQSDEEAFILRSMVGIMDMFQESLQRNQESSCEGVDNDTEFLRDHDNRSLHSVTQMPQEASHGLEVLSPPGDIESPPCRPLQSRPPPASLTKKQQRALLEKMVQVGHACSALIHNEGTDTTVEASETDSWSLESGAWSSYGGQLQKMRTPALVHVPAAVTDDSIDGASTEFKPAQTKIELKNKSTDQYIDETSHDAVGAEGKIHTPEPCTVCEPVAHSDLAVGLSAKDMIKSFLGAARYTVMGMHNLGQPSSPLATAEQNSPPTPDTAGWRPQSPESIGFDPDDAYLEEGEESHLELDELELRRGIQYL